MAIFLDPSVVLAAADRADLNHAAAVAWFGRAAEPLFLSALSLAELDTLFQRELGEDATPALVRSITEWRDPPRRTRPTGTSSGPCELLEAAREHRPRLADAALVAMAERLGVHRIATFDRRPIAVFRPRHSRAFDLEP